MFYLSVNVNIVFESQNQWINTVKKSETDYLIVELAPLNNHFPLSKHAFCVHIKKSMKFNLKMERKIVLFQSVHV